MSFAFMPVYTGDYHRDTRHLTPEEHGVYMLLLMHCWDQKGPVPLDERRQCGLVNARSGGEIESLRRVLLEFFTRMDDGWYNQRMTEEIAKAEGISQHRRLGGLEKARRQRDAVRSAQAVLKQSMSIASAGTPTPTPTLTPTEKTETTPCPVPAAPAPDGGMPGFDAFWKAYPNQGRRNDKKKCLEVWRRQQLEGSADQIIGHVLALKQTPKWRRDAAGQSFEPAPLVYLRGRRWEDGLPEAPAAARSRLAI